MRKWIAGCVAVSWLFTFVGCALDSQHMTDTLGAHTAQFAAHVHTDDSHPGGDSQTDTCCQVHQTAISLLAAPEIHLPPVLVTLVPAALFVLLAALSSGPVRRRNGIAFTRLRPRQPWLTNSLQPQAPPV